LTATGEALRRAYDARGLAAQRAFDHEAQQRV
jgi:hypothetical protein